MRTILMWFARGGIAVALAMLIITVWPSDVVEQSQSFVVNTADSIPATIRFRAPGKLYRGAQTEFSVLLDLDTIPVVDESVHPVMVYRLELEGAEIVPDAVFQIPLAGVQHQEVRWLVRLPLDGIYNGTWWVYIEYVGQGGEIIDQQALFARRLTIESRGILGFSVTATRWLSMIVIVLGLGLEIWWILHRKSASG